MRGGVLRRRRGEVLRRRRGEVPGSGGGSERRVSNSRFLAKEECAAGYSLTSIAFYRGVRASDGWRPGGSRARILRGTLSPVHLLLLSASIALRVCL